MEGVFRAAINDLRTQFGLERLDEHGSSLKMRFGGPSPLVTWDQLHEPGSNLVVCLRDGPELLGTVA